MLYIGREPIEMKNHIRIDNGTTVLDYQYHLLDISQLNPELLLTETNPKILLLAFLTKIADNQKIIESLVAKINDNDDRVTVKKHFAMLGIIVQLRPHLEPLIRQVMEKMTIELDEENKIVYLCNM